MSSTHSNLKKLILVFTAKGVKGVGGLLLAWVLAKKYGAYGSGVFFIGYTFAFLCASFAQLGIGNGCLRYIPQLRAEDESNLSSMWTISQLIVGAFALLLSAMVMLFAEPAAGLVFKDVSKWAYIFCAAPIIFFWSLTRINIMVRQSLGDMSGITLVENLIIPAGMLLFGGLSFVIDFSVLVFLATVTSLYFISFLYAFFSTRKDYNLRFSLKLRSSLRVREILIYSIPLLVIAFSQTSLIWINTLILGAVGAVVDAALFVAAMKVAVSISILLYTFNSVYAPQISSAYARDDFDSIRSLYRDATHALTFCSFLLLAVVAVYAEVIMNFFGAQYDAGAACLLWMLVGQICNCYTGPVGYLLILSGKSKLEVYNTVAGLVLNAGLCLLFYKTFGVSGAGLAFCLSNVLINLLRYFQCRRFFRINWLDRTQKYFIGMQMLLVCAFLLLNFYSVNRELLVAVLSAVYLLLNISNVSSLISKLGNQH
ncbi:polysaccharide biosynthesis C-terminal domain-containing protein [Desulfovibrio sp. JC010]|uniref:polysaccharide biosynthesis C-terminal domain-containing protein n=1 Tax=Desulfovibrio sp. JC010 TaxID=2593641 RepID=UPI0013D852C1|nr:polysaccharide biosynthesis C-terminal domain-containing protein [Desulfovibrio sp. JC010]NDV26515.1 polysaccharide biosynthesis protein [Desulfovibrio sp. JC010]